MFERYDDKLLLQLENVLEDKSLEDLFEDNDLTEIDVLYILFDLGLIDLTFWNVEK
jgi:hypothetical protein